MSAFISNISFLWLSMITDRNQWKAQCTRKLFSECAVAHHWLRLHFVFYRLHAPMKFWREILAVLMLLLVPMHALAASLSALNCHTGEAHQAPVDAHVHGTSQISHTHEGAASHQHEADPGVDPSGFSKCHHVFSGMPATPVVNAPAELPEFESTISLLLTLFVPERPQRPPRG